MVKVAVCGAAGRMGQRIIVAITEAEGIELSGALERPGHPLVGQDAGLLAGCGELKVKISDDINAVVEGCDVLIDFTTPKVSLKNLEVCALKKKSIVIGSTGFTPEERALAAELAKEIPAVLAPNMSVGVNVCFKVLKDVAKTLGDDFDVEIVELHHNKKKDSPSGTAVRMGEVVAEASGATTTRWPTITGKESAASGPRKRSACRRSAAATSSVSTPSTSSAWVSGSRFPTGP